MLDILLNTPLLIVTIWVALYLFDALATNWYRDVSEEFMSNYFIYQGGIEMNPRIEEEINNSKKLGLNFYLNLTKLALYIFLFIWICKFFTDFSYGWIFSKFIELFSGSIILVWLYVDLHHLYNYGRILLLKAKPNSLSGKMIQTYWYSQMLSAIDSMVFGILYLCIGILTFRIFFIGGALACIIWSIKHYYFSTRNQRQ